MENQPSPSTCMAINDEFSIHLDFRESVAVFEQQHCPTVAISSLPTSSSSSSLLPSSPESHLLQPPITALLKSIGKSPIHEGRLIETFTSNLYCSKDSSPRRPLLLQEGNPAVNNSSTNNSDDDGSNNPIMKGENHNISHHYCSLCCSSFIEALVDAPHDASTIELTPDLLKEFQEAFTLFDSDGDGEISTGEVGTVLRSMGQNPSEGELNELIAEIDVDHSGSIDFPEFLAIVKEMINRNYYRCEVDDEIREAFSYFDKENTGMVSGAEMRHVLENLGGTEEEVDEMMREADIDGTGGPYNYEELLKMMMRK